MKRFVALVFALGLMMALLPLSAYANDSIIIPEGHTHNWGEWYVTEMATCDSTGAKARTCPDCGMTQTSAIPKTNDHDWNDWEIVKRASVFRKGTKSHTCYECGTTVKKTIPKLKPFARFTRVKWNAKAGKSYNMHNKLKVAYGDKAITWKSSNKSIATVNKAGKVVTKKGGTVKIIAYTKAKKRATCVLKVKAPARKRASSSSSSVTRSGGTSNAGGSGIVYWTPSGYAYHCTSSCKTLSRSRTVFSGSMRECPKTHACKVCY